MKKFLALLLFVLYMGSSTGATFRTHYCKGELVEVALGADDHDPCGGCEAKKQKDCCKSEHKTVKLEKDQKAAENALTLQVAAAVVPVFYKHLFEQFAVPPVEEFPVSNAPPRSSKVRPGILHCTFLI